ncbi:MAG: ATP-binding protein [Verrucomicrobia bacterium]|nr:ATP-binding protein [Verrucomicrobiota bacterium]
MRRRCTKRGLRRGHGRSGLGLAICRSIISARGGFIEVTSTPGTGTTFSVQLPIARNRESASPTCET